jgi:hypothetical protein
VAGRLNCYRVAAEKWKLEPTKNVFSDSGYNQLLVDGQVDHTLENAFSRVERHLPIIFNHLERAADVATTELPPSVYENLCWYLAFLRRVSPFAKAAAPMEFLAQIHKELEHGSGRTLKEVLGAPEDVIERFKQEYDRGNRLIIDSEDFCS